MIMRDLASNEIIYSSKRKSFRPGFFVATAIVLIGAATMVFPYLWMFLTSFKSNNEAFSRITWETIFPKKWLVDCYMSLLTDKSFYLAILWTLVIESSVILVGTFFSAMAAFAFAKLKLKGGRAILLMLMSSMMVPYAAVMLPQYRVFQSLHMTETLWPLILPGFFGNISMTFFLFTYMKEGIPDALIEQAKIDGSSYLRMFIHIGLPLAKPAIAAQAIFWFVGIWNDFFGPSIYLTGETKTLQVYLYSIVTSSTGGTDLPLMMAGSVLTSLPMIIIFLVFQNFFINSIALSGMKE